MKKYLAIFAVLFTVILSSCSNDDIPVSYNCIVRVNPATVMSGFTYQVKPGDLDGVSSGNELRIRLYIFDEEGALVEQLAQFVPNYLTTASFETTIPNGKMYQLVALTDEVRKSDDFEWWSVSDENQISTMKISYKGAVYDFGSQEILGLKSDWIYSGDNPTVNVEAAGALVCTLCSNLHAYSNVGSVLIFANRTNGYYDFSNADIIESNPILDENSTLISLKDIPNKKTQASYSYKFMMPQKNMRIYYGISDTKGDVLAVSAAEGVELEMGREYKCYLTFDPNNDGSGDYSYGINPISTGRGTSSECAIMTEEALVNGDDETYSVMQLIKIQCEK